MPVTHAIKLHLYVQKQVCVLTRSHGIPVQALPAVCSVVVVVIVQIIPVKPILLHLLLNTNKDHCFHTVSLNASQETFTLSELSELLISGVEQQCWSTSYLHGWPA